MIRWLYRWQNMILAVMLIVAVIYMASIGWYYSTHLTANLTKVDAVAENEYMRVYVELK